MPRAFMTCVAGLSVAFTMYFVPARGSADSPDCDNPRQPVSNRLATAIETAVRTCGCSVNISHTLCSRHGESPAHSEARAVDINIVDGAPVGPDNDAARRLQEIFQGMSAIEENLGPFIRERRRSDGTMAPAGTASDDFKAFIHISVFPPQ